MASIMVREVVGVFGSPKALQNAVDELLVHGFDRSLLSLMASPATVERALGLAMDRVGRLADDPRTPRTAYIGSDSRIEGKSVAAGFVAYLGVMTTAGVMAATDMALPLTIAATAAAGGAGGVIGAVMGRFVDRRHVANLQAQIDHGGILLWIRTVTPEWERIAGDLLARNGAVEVHAHDLPHDAAGRGGGVSQALAWIDKPLPYWLGGTGRRAAHRADLHPEP